jgi:RecA-family ATPase
VSGAVTTTWLSDVRAVRVRWAWHKRIPLGALTILAGQPGLGKSTITAELAARLSRGELVGDLAAERTLFATFEDAAANVVRPRVELAGGDVAAVGVVRLTGGDLLTLPLHVNALADEVERTGARLLVIDPLVAAIDDTVDSNRDASVRRVLAPLAAMSERLEIATVCVMHFNKSQAELLLRVGGSIGFMGQARSALVVMADPEAADADDSRRLLAHIKSNYAAKQPTLACELRNEMSSTRTASRARWRAW